MDQCLKDKTTVITGGGGILGREFCRGLAEAGSNIAIIDIDKKAMDESLKICKEINPSGKFQSYECDITDKKDVEQTVATIRKEFGKIDILHNNAASKSSSLDRFFDSYEDFQEKIWDEVMAVNVKGMFLMSQQVGKAMIEDGVKGSIIQTSSIYGHKAPDQRIYAGSEYNGRPINTPAVYSTSKAAVHGLTMYLATYWAEKGIRVNTLTPGGMFSGQNDEFTKKYSARVPMNRMGQPHELVPTLIFLASDMASYITGQNIMVDGGLSVW